MPKIGDTVSMKATIEIFGNYTKLGWIFYNFVTYDKDNNPKLERFVEYDLEREVDDLCSELNDRHEKE